MLKLETERLIITEFMPDMAYDVHINSLDEDNRRFVPDEVFETVDEAQKTVEFLISCYGQKDKPLVYPVLLKNGTNIGYVQTVPIDGGVEIGYHIAKKYTLNGYATEAVKVFAPFMMKKLNLNVLIGICLADNAASRRVLEKCGFDLIYEGNGNYQGDIRKICRYVMNGSLIKL